MVTLVFATPILTIWLACMNLSGVFIMRIQTSFHRFCWLTSNRYTATYTASKVSTGNQAILKLGGWGSNRASEKYDITAAPEISGITVNDHIFAKDSGFPTTGFTGATFTLKLTTGSLSDYTWTSDASWVSVTDGTVKFTGTGSGDKARIMVAHRM